RDGPRVPDPGARPRQDRSGDAALRGDPVGDPEQLHRLGRDPGRLWFRGGGAQARQALPDDAPHRGWPAGGRSGGKHPAEVHPARLKPLSGSSLAAQDGGGSSASWPWTSSAISGASSQPFRRAPSASITPGRLEGPTNGSPSGVEALTPAAPVNVAR